MTTRTRHFKISFPSPFTLYGIEGIQPAGEYVVEQDEKLLEEEPSETFCPFATFIHLPPASNRGGNIRVVPVDPSELQDVKGSKYAPANQA